MILLDTDHFSVVVDRRHALHKQLIVRLEGAIDSLAIPVVSVEEQVRGWLAQLRRVTDVSKQITPYDRLIVLLETLADWEIARWSESAAEQFKRLRRG